MKELTYDIVVCGGGAGGLSFMSNWLGSSLNNLRVLLVEKELKNERDRTWCYWAKEPLPYPESHVKTWKKVRIAHQAKDTIKTSATQRYFEINSQKFYQEVHKQLETLPNFVKCKATVTDIRPRIQYCEVDTTIGTVRANYVINSIPDLLQQLPGRYLLTQNFKGIRIKTSKPVFDPELVELMDFFPVSEEKTASFFYVLPYSETDALIEFTRLSTDIWNSDAYDEYLKTYLKEKYDVSDFQVYDSEFGVIPMTDFPYERKPHPRVFQIGIVGGDTKATTGYTFHFIQNHARAIVQEITNTAQPRSSGLRFKFYDKLLLTIILKQPEKTAEIMFKLFNRLPLSLVFKFLDERTNLFEEAFIFSHLPKEIFLKALFQLKTVLYEKKSEVFMGPVFRRAR